MSFAVALCELTTEARHAFQFNEFTGEFTFRPSSKALARSTDALHIVLGISPEYTVTTLEGMGFKVVHVFWYINKH